MKKLERIEVGYINTPLEYLANFSKKVNKHKIYIKRDDLTGLALGGNKTRKLDYFVKDALDKGYTTLLTYGAYQTNHGRLTIAAATKHGMKSILVIEGEEPKSMEANLLLDALMDTTLVFIAKNNKSDEEYQKYKEECVNKLISDLEMVNEKVYEIPMGGSNALGSYGYFCCIEEIILQSKNLDIKHLICPYGSAGTFAGLWLGAKYFNADFDIIGIPVFVKPFDLELCISLIKDLAKLLEIDVDVSVADLRIEGGLDNNIYALPEYGKANDKTLQAIKDLASSEAIFCDPVYSGKALAGMIDLLEKDELSGNCLFLHTGGSPALFTTSNTRDFQKILFDE